MEISPLSCPVHKFLNIWEDDFKGRSDCSCNAPSIWENAVRETKVANDLSLGLDMARFLAWGVIGWWGQNANCFGR